MAPRDHRDRGSAARREGEGDPDGIPYGLGPRRIAVWSGPRNISTALMRSFEARGDTAVSDEPLYASFLAATGLEHPGRAEILDHHETDHRRVACHLLGAVPGDRPIWYQKHMAHHLLPDFDGGWLEGLEHVFLIRDPRKMIVSLDRVLPWTPRIEDTGLPQQLDLFTRETIRTGTTPPVIDSEDVLRDPRGTLQALCRRIDLPWSDRMLKWRPGPRPTDGIWAKHWYDNVHRSTGFGPLPTDEPAVTARLRPVLDTVEPMYRELAAHAVRPDPPDAPAPTETPDAPDV